MPTTNKKIHSAGFVCPYLLSVRPVGLRSFDMDFLAVTISGEAYFMMKEGGISSFLDKISLVYVPAGIEHIYEPRDRELWENYWVIFDHSAVSQAFSNLMPSPGITRLDEFGKLEGYWEKMILATLAGEEQADDQAFCMLHNILLEMSLQSSSKANNNHSLTIRKAVEKMQNSIREAELNFEHIAANYGIGLDTLRKKFKKETNISLHQYFIQLKIRAAKTLLSNLAYNVSDIANYLGFDDPYYFSRLFKNKTGVSPRDYRKSLKGKKVDYKNQF